MTVKQSRQEQNNYYDNNINNNNNDNNNDKYNLNSGSLLTDLVQCGPLSQRAA